MTLRRCAMPGCAGDATGIFCPDHYFMLPGKQARFLVSWQIKIARCEDDDLKAHMREALHGYTQEAIRTLQNSEAQHSPVPPRIAPAAASPLPAAGATPFQRSLPL